MGHGFPSRCYYRQPRSSTIDDRNRESLPTLLITGSNKVTRKLPPRGAAAREKGAVV